MPVDGGVFVRIKLDETEMKFLRVFVMVLGIGLAGCSPRGNDASCEGGGSGLTAVEVSGHRDDAAVQSSSPQNSGAGVEPMQAPSPRAVVPSAVPAADPGSEPEPADNFYCFVCHANYDGEKLALDHELVGVGCATCHGVSDRHSADEDGITPPDKMFARDEINAYCMTCHAEADIRDSISHKPLFDETSEDKHLCTDCHGEHRLTVRTRHWDKKTGKLISDDGVRMMYEDSPTRPKP